MNNSTWEINLKEYQKTGTPIWYRNIVYMSCPAFVQGRDVVYVGASKETYKINKDGIVSGGYWISPTLNREDPKAEYTLKKVNLKYKSAGATTITIEGSGDGGVTWVNGNHTTVALASSSIYLRRAVQHLNVTGPDVRFRLTFPSNYLVEIFHWDVEMLQRGNLKSE